MNKYLAVALLLLGGCTSSTEFGDCIGLGQDKDPNLSYKVSGWNVAMGVIFFEVIVPPIVVLTDKLYCPIAKKTATNK